MLIPCSALRVLRIQPPKALTTPSPLVGEGWGGGSLLPRAVPQQLRPPPLTPPHPKSGLPDLRVVMRNSGKPRARARDAASQWLARVGLAGFEARYPHMLSGGQRKRVALAQVLIRNPKILLMDEPFGPLDAQTRQIMGNLLLDLWSADRKAVLFINHDLEEAIALADRV